MQRCERCGKKVIATIMSRFNLDVCCIPCADTEKKHPDYEHARDTEHNECVKGNYNFAGVGLPENYFEWVKTLDKK